MLDSVVRGKKAEPAAAAEVCVASTEPALERQIATQLRIAAFPDAFSDVSAAWATMDEGERADEGERHQAWWEAFFADELPAWERGLSGGAWSDRLLADLTDRPAFEAFSNELSTEQRPHAIELWQRAWFDKIGLEMLSSHLREIAGMLTHGSDAPLERHPDPERILLFEVMERALLASGEHAIRRLVGSSA